MDGILQAHEHLVKKANLSPTIDDVQKLIDHLQNTRDAIVADPDNAALHMAKLKRPVKDSFDSLEDDLKEVNKGLNQYQKALKDKFKNAVLPTVPNDALSSQPDLINRAIAMHLLREGKFDVAKTFVKEVGEKSPPDEQKDTGGAGSWVRDFAVADDPMHADMAATSEGKTESGTSGLQTKFAEMYYILHALRGQHNLQPAVDWAAQHSVQLEKRGSNLEFELSRLKFVELYKGEDVMSDDVLAGPLRALEYARSVFPSFSERYQREVSDLMGSLSFSPNLADSPYHAIFYNDHAFEEASASFTREFCGLLGLSSQSPLFTAVTAGGIALPVLEKVERVMAQTRGQWTSVNELPVETPLPPGYQFHNIFVCPVSKEQATDTNYPVQLTCGHAIAKESLENASKGRTYVVLPPTKSGGLTMHRRMKCPYCPSECHPREAKRLYI